MAKYEIDFGLTRRRLRARELRRASTLKVQRIRGLRLQIQVNMRCHTNDVIPFLICKQLIIHCSFRNNIVVVEWKTSQRTKSTLEDAYDDPVQIAAYVSFLLI